MKKIKHSVADKGDNDTGLSSKVELEVIGIVRHKILFKNRPKALISSSHTVGVAHCSSFKDRLYNFTGTRKPDPAMNPLLLHSLKHQCPKDANVDNTANLDQITSTLTFTAACESVGIIVLISNDFNRCAQNHCTRFETATTMAFMSWFQSFNQFLVVDLLYILCGLYKRLVVQVWSLAQPDWTCKIDQGLASIAYAIWSLDIRHILTTSDFQLRLTIWSLVNTACVHVQCPKHATFSSDQDDNGTPMTQGGATS